jgi:hypothetical protein
MRCALFLLNELKRTRSSISNPHGLTHLSVSMSDSACWRQLNRSRALSMDTSPRSSVGRGKRGTLGEVHSTESTLPCRASDSHANHTHPTALLEIDGIRLLTDPTFDPPGSEFTNGPVILRKTAGPAVASSAQLEPINAVLLSHDQSIRSRISPPRATCTYHAQRRHPGSVDTLRASRRDNPRGLFLRITLWA